MTTTRDDAIRYLESKIEEVMADIKRREEHLENLKGAVSFLKNEALPETLPTNVSNVAELPIGKLRNLTQLQAIVTIANHNGGTVRAQDAKRLMIRAGVMRETRNSTNITHNVIIRS